MAGITSMPDRQSFAAIKRAKHFIFPSGADPVEFAFEFQMNRSVSSKRLMYTFTLRTLALDPKWNPTRL